MNSSKTIVVIDDDKKFSFGLVAVLRRAGYRVETAYNGDEGLAAIRSEKPDLIISDIMMPPPNGIQLRKELTKDPRFGRIPFLFLTARTALMDKVVGLESGADDYITKPFDVNELLGRIQAVLRRDDLGYKRGLEDMNQALDQLRSRISANLSHEMKTPLTILLGTLDNVMKEKFTENNVELSEYIAKASNSAHRLKFLIEDLEMLHAIDQKSLNTFRQAISIKYHLLAPVEQVLKTWESKSLSINWMIDSETVIYAPRNEFSHVVAHLVDNACKFSPENKQIQILVQPNRIGGCRLEVIDQGMGIPVDLREKVFERYFQVDQKEACEYGGLGLGLTIARAFAEALDGDVQIMDSPNGCRVRMILPPAKLD